MKPDSQHVYYHCDQCTFPKLNLMWRQYLSQWVTIGKWLLKTKTKIIFKVLRLIPLKLLGERFDATECWLCCVCLSKSPLEQWPQNIFNWTLYWRWNVFLKQIKTVLESFFGKRRQGSQHVLEKIISLCNFLINMAGKRYTQKGWFQTLKAFSTSCYFLQKRIIIMLQGGKLYYHTVAQYIGRLNSNEGDSWRSIHSIQGSTDSIQ